MNEPSCCAESFIQYALPLCAGGAGAPGAGAAIGGALGAAGGALVGNELQKREQVANENEQAIAQQKQELAKNRELIEELKKQIKKLKSKNGWLSADQDAKRISKELQERVNALLSMLEKHAKTVRPIAKTNS